MPPRAEMGGQDQVLGRRGTPRLSPAHHCTLTRVLGTKSYFPEPSSSGTSNILMLSPSSFCIKKKVKKKMKNQQQQNTKTHTEKRGVFFLLLFKKTTPQKSRGGGREFLSRHFSRPLCMCVSVSKLQVEFCNTSGSFFPCVNNIYIYF